MEKLYRVQINKNGMPNFSTAGEVESKQGEWIEFGTISHNYECSVCGRKIFSYNGRQEPCVKVLSLLPLWCDDERSR